MLILLAIPVPIAVAAMHRYLAIFAPTNMLVRRVRAQEPRWQTGVMLVGFALGLLVIMHAAAGAVADGAPGWLNLVVLVLAWDAIKIALAALLTTARVVIATIRSIATVPRP